MKSDPRSRWVVCLNCGHQYYLESYIRRSNCFCPQCNSKQNKPADSANAWEEDAVCNELKYICKRSY